MLRHIMVAHSVLHNSRPDLDAHARFNCAYHKSGRRISDFFRSIVHYPGFSAKRRDKA